MVVSRLIGGLGNQMFQYAAGRALAIPNNCELKLDISGFENYPLHNGYELNIFNIKAAIANSRDVEKLVTTQSRFMSLIYRRLKIKKSTHYIENSFSFDPSYFHARPPVYLDGYWQSYKYFESVYTELKQEFSFKSPLSGVNLQIAEKISNVNAISVHVRRGDYVSNKNTNSVHGVCSLDYYYTAMQTMKERIINPVFFIFSDDMKWTKENLGSHKNFVFVEHNQGATSYEDMRLMSMCKHHIIANSSFSWWGAWLSHNASKIVLYPDKWFATYDRDTSTLCLPEWERV